MEYVIRRAEAADASGACETVRRSIAELCIADHDGDPTTIAAWLSNKTVPGMASWIASPGNVAVVATAAADILGFALMSASGRLALLYVSPDARFQGVSKALMSFIEQEACRLGIRAITLDSSATARQFYSGRGFSASGEPSVAFGKVIAYPMSKRLSPELATLRETVDDIDFKLVELLARRFEATDKIGALKAEHGLGAVDPGREHQQRERLSALASQRGLSESLVLGIFREVVAEVVRNHERLAARPSSFDGSREPTS